MNHTYHSKITRLAYLKFYCDMTAVEIGKLNPSDRDDLFLQAGFEISKLYYENKREYDHLLYLSGKINHL